MSFSASSRGASLFGMLIFLCLFAVGVESQTVSSTGSVASSDNTQSISTPTCEVGLDFIIEQTDEGAKISYASRSDNRAAEPNKLKANRCDVRPGAPFSETYVAMTIPGGSLPARWCQEDSTSNRDSTRKNWTCRTYVCRLPKKDSRKTGNVCFTAKEVAQLGQAVKQEQAIKSAESSALTAITSSDNTVAQNGTEFMTRQPLASGDEILKSMGGIDRTIAEENNKINTLNTERATLLEQYAKCRDGAGNDLQPVPTRAGLVNGGCPHVAEQLKDIDQNILTSRDAIRKLEEQKARLASLQKPLTPADSKTFCTFGEPNCANFPQPSNQEPPALSRLDEPSPDRWGRTGFRDTPNPYDEFFGLNANQPQDAYCVVRLEPIMVHQYQARPGCYNYRQGATGGYGGFRSGYDQSNRCGSPPNFGGGLGGIISGVISLFSKNSGGNSNCTPDGVPKPQCTITASPTNIQSPGQQVTLSWQSEDAFAATLSSNGSVGVNGSQMVQPQQTTTYTLSLQGYRNTQTGQVLSGQCSTQVVVGGTGTTTNGDPKAQIACSPQSADVGMSVAISYSCLNSNTSSGAGFATNNQLSGSATPVVASPSIGSDSVTYGLTCSKEGKTDSAQCTVRVNKTSMVLVANPKNVESGEEANIGWVTSGMQSCTISSPQLSGFTSDNAGNTSVSGVTRTPPLTSDATFVLTCTSRSGATKMVEVKVEVD